MHEGEEAAEDQKEEEEESQDTGGHPEALSFHFFHLDLWSIWNWFWHRAEMGHRLTHSWPGGRAFAFSLCYCSSTHDQEIHRWTGQVCCSIQDYLDWSWSSTFSCHFYMGGHNSIDVQTHLHFPHPAAVLNGLFWILFGITNTITKVFQNRNIVRPSRRYLSDFLHCIRGFKQLLLDFFLNFFMVFSTTINVIEKLNFHLYVIGFETHIEMTP